MKRKGKQCFVIDAEKRKKKKKCWLSLYLEFSRPLHFFIQLSCKKKKKKHQNVSVDDHFLHLWSDISLNKQQKKVMFVPQELRFDECVRVYLSIYLSQSVSISVGQLKSSYTDQDTLMEFDQMRFIFQQSHLCSTHDSSIGVAVL